MEQNAPPLEILLSGVDLCAGAGPGRGRSRAAGHAEGHDGRDPGTPQSLPSIHGEAARHRLRPARVSRATTSRESRKTVTFVFADPEADVAHRRTAVGRGAARRHDALLRRDAGRRWLVTAGRSRSSSATRSWPSTACPSATRTTRIRAIRAAADMQAALPALNAAVPRRMGTRAAEPHRREHRRGDRRRRVDRPAPGDRRRRQHGRAARAGGRARRDHPRRPDLSAGARRDRRRGDRAAHPQGQGGAGPAYRFVALAGHDPIAAESESAPFVGREAEMARLDVDTRPTLSERPGAALLTVVGDAGVGKSRLIREFAPAAVSSGARRPRPVPAVWRRHHVLADRRDRARCGRDRLGRQPSRRRSPRSTSWSRISAWRTRDRAAVVDRVASMLGLTSGQFPVAELFWGIRKLLEALAREATARDDRRRHPRGRDRRCWTCSITSPRPSRRRPS